MLTPRRTSGGRRVFEEPDVARVEVIRALLAAGLNTETIRVVLPCTSYRGGRLLPTCPEMLGHLARQQARQAASIAQLERSQREIAGILAAAPPELTDPARHAALHGAQFGT
nr:MerR family transcriptional regulator [Streptomyces sp. FH025]